MSERGHGPAVPFPPPLLFVMAFLIGWLLDQWVFHLWPSVPERVDHAITVAGWVLVMAGLSLASWGIATFLRRRTAIYPNRDASTLVIEGPYRLSRNPMYTGMMVGYVGGCAVASSLWPLILLPLALMALVKLVIAREERYLTGAFGDSYRDYQRRVGRWMSWPSQGNT